MNAIPKSPEYVASSNFDVCKVLREVASTAPTKLKAASLALDIPMGGTSLGWGVKFAGPGSEMQGQNERAKHLHGPIRRWQTRKGHSFQNS